MSTLTADSKSMHHSVSQIPASSLSGPLRVDMVDMRLSDAKFDQSTLIAYVSCFIKNFIGASGSNTVAIDNKIEQAMDLVKSHLMFAVREEVEVLKEKISELMERIGQLEYENTILKANATPEIIAQIQSKSSHTGGNSNAPNNNNS